VYDYIINKYQAGKPGYDNARYYAIQITPSQFLDKPRDASTTEL